MTSESETESNRTKGNKRRKGGINLLFAGSPLPAPMSEAHPVPAEDSRPRQSTQDLPAEWKASWSRHRWSLSVTDGEFIFKLLAAA